MRPKFRDITSQAGQPDWYDLGGIPRYGKFSPDVVAQKFKHPGADYVALMLIMCQNCRNGFRVAVHYHRAMEETERWIFSADEDKMELPARSDPGWFHYGDPPAHGCIGDTMNSIPWKVLQFWIWSQDRGWARWPEYEVGVIPHWAFPRECIPDSKRKP